MAKALSARVPDNVTLATTVTRLTRSQFEIWSKLTIDRVVSGTATSIYVDLIGTADGAALHTPASSSTSSPKPACKARSASSP